MFARNVPTLLTRKMALDVIVEASLPGGRKIYTQSCSFSSARGHALLGIKPARLFVVNMRVELPFSHRHFRNRKYPAVICIRVDLKVLGVPHSCQINRPGILPSNDSPAHQKLALNPATIRGKNDVYTPFSGILEICAGSE